MRESGPERRTLSPGFRRDQRRCVGLVVGLLFTTAPALAEPRVETRTLSGLQSPAEIVVDRHGIPHLYAASERDAFFLQGYNAARDRLWQIDLWRKRGLGRLSASFGPAYVEQDRAARLFLYRGDMAAEWAAYAPDAKAWTEAFVAGVNAYVEETRTGARPLPPEFGLTGSAPELWTADDVVRIRSHALASNVDAEVERARVVCAGGIEADRLRDVLEPAHQTAVPEGLDVCSVPEDVLETYTLGTRAVRFDAGSVRPVAEGPAAVADGSNNWVIAPSRTATGRPMLANDPHRAHALPSLRYLVHMEAPGLSLIGAGEPALPGVSLGHNGRIAFGLTILPIDQQDLYAYALKPGDPLRYRYGRGWEPMTVVRERIEVRGGPARTVDLPYTRHGPVLARSGGQAFALRSIWSEPGTSAYFASTWYAKAQDWTDFRRAQAAWGAPPLNLVYADTAGEIGWVAAGKTPLRPNWDGLLPVPGDGRYEWRGFRPGASLPAVRNPAKGWFATANEYNVSAEEARGLSFEWSNPSRADRVKDVLRTHPAMTLQTSAALQTDVYSTFAARTVALLSGAPSAEPRVTEAALRLRAWDKRVAAESWEAAVFEVWSRDHLTAAVVAAAAPAPARETLDELRTPLAAVIWLEREATPVQRERLLLDSLGAALTDLDKRLGPDRTAWRWGRLHAITFTPTTAALRPAAERAALSVGPFEMPGSDATPRAAGYNAEFAMVHGASVRLVLDVGAWDQSLAISTPGPSGDPASPHYRDLAPLWARGGYVPLPYTRAAVDAAAETVIRLTPAASR